MPPETWIVKHMLEILGNPQAATVMTIAKVTVGTFTVGVTAYAVHAFRACRYKVRSPEGPRIITLDKQI
jgi:hypothetical protein